MNLEQIRQERRDYGNPVEVIFDDNTGCTGKPLHRLTYPNGRWEWVTSDTVFHCTGNAPDDCDELVNPYGDGLCVYHRAAAGSSVAEAYLRSKGRIA